MREVGRQSDLRHLVRSVVCIYLHTLSTKTAAFRVPVMLSLLNFRLRSRAVFFLGFYSPWTYP